MPKGMHNPLPASLGSECKKATQILDSFINGSWRGSPGRELPESVLRNAKGLAVLTVTKAGFLGSLRFGSGILIARLPENDAGSGGWSPPSAISIAGFGFGGQVGFELADFVFILNSTESLATFSKLGSLTVSGNFSIAFGPVGRTAEIAGGVNVTGGGKMMTFAKTHGLFGGVSLESGVFVERRWANKRFYGRKVTAGEILEGRVDVPAGENGAVDEGVSGLMMVLGEIFVEGGPSQGGPSSSGNQDGDQEASQENQPSTRSGRSLQGASGSDENHNGDHQGRQENQPDLQISHGISGSDENQNGDREVHQENQPDIHTEAARN